MSAVYVLAAVVVFVGVGLIITGWSENRADEWKSIREREQVNAALSLGLAHLEGEGSPVWLSQSAAKDFRPTPAPRGHGLAREAAGNFDGGGR